jgi:integrase
MEKVEKNLKEKFIERFGKPINEFESIKRITESGKINKLTASKYINELPKFFLYIDMSPDEAIEQRLKELKEARADSLSIDSLNQTGIETLVDKMFRELNESGNYKASTLKSFSGRVMGFFSNNHKSLALTNLNYKLPKPKGKANRKNVPNTDFVRKLYRLADSARDRGIISILFQSGLAPIDVSKLTIADFEDCIIKQEGYENRPIELEAWTYRTGNRSKTGELYYQVITPEIAHNLNDMFFSLGNYQDVDKKQQVFKGTQGDLDSKGVSMIVYNLIRNNKLRHYKVKSLRDAYEQALVDAKVYQKYKEALMGHTSNIDHTYGDTDKEIVNTYKSAYPYLKLNDVMQKQLKEKEESQRVKELLAEIATLKETIRILSNQTTNFMTNTQTNIANMNTTINKLYREIERVRKDTQELKEERNREAHIHKET